MAIIDYLQRYNVNKQIEYNWKSYVLCFGKDLISSVPSKLYAERFYKFMRSEVIIDEREDADERNRFSLSSSVRTGESGHQKRLAPENNVLKRITSQV